MPSLHVGMPGPNLFATSLFRARCLVVLPLSSGAFVSVWVRLPPAVRPVCVILPHRFVAVFSVLPPDVWLVCIARSCFSVAVRTVFSAVFPVFEIRVLV